MRAVRSRTAGPAPSAASRRPPRHRILWITIDADGHLVDCDALSEFDAVIIDQSLAVIATDADLQAEVVGHRSVELSLVRGVRSLLERRHREMLGLLVNGGLVVIRLRRPQGIVAQQGPLWNPAPDAVGSWDIWVPLVEYLAAIAERGQDVVIEAAGRSVQVSDPEHLLDTYLRTASYSAVLTPLVENVDSSTVLATNRAGDPVALEVRLGEGFLLLVPSDGDTVALEQSIDAILDLRRAFRDDWPVPDESAALADLHDAATDFRHRRDAAIAAVQAAWDLKRAVLADPDVRRVLDYFRVATAQDADQSKALGRLTRMVELIGDLCGGEHALPARLGISKALIDAVKGPANRRVADVRHAQAGPVIPLTDAEVGVALSAASKLAQAFVTARYEEAKMSLAGAVATRAGAATGAST